MGTHGEARVQWWKEGMLGLGAGFLYGTTSVCVGHPFDTIKTKMQAQAGFDRISMFQTILKTLREQKIIGLYRGCIPPLLGSGIYRSVPVAVFEAVYTYLDNPFARYEIPGTPGIQIRVIVAGVLGSTGRAIVETPLEYAKVKRQTQQNWKLRNVYTGFGVTWCRTVGLMTTYFILLDSGRRNFPETVKIPILGPFLLASIAGTSAWWLIWPLENLKNQIQTGYKKDISVVRQIAWIIRKEGIRSLYRGILPGSMRSFFANGISMIVMTHAQKKITDFGLRDS